MTCPTGKKVYLTTHKARRVIRHMDKRRADEKAANWHSGPSMVYRCAVCHGWHIGHSTAPVKNRKPRYEPVCDWSAA